MIVLQGTVAPRFRNIPTVIQYLTPLLFQIFCNADTYVQDFIPHSHTYLLCTSFRLHLYRQFNQSLPSFRVMWGQMCVLISLSEVYTQHWECFHHCEGDNWKKKKKAHPPILTACLSLQTAAKMKSLIRQGKAIQTLLVIPLVSHNPHMLHALVLA